MNDDVECPYCGAEQEINHDDGYGYTEDQAYEQECGECEKTFVFHTSISFYYSVNKADCLNGGEHKYRKTCTYPKKYTKMRCQDCDHERAPTARELYEILQLGVLYEAF